jgi:hypothetical protein
MSRFELRAGFEILPPNYRKTREGHALRTRNGFAVNRVLDLEIAAALSRVRHEG